MIAFDLSAIDGPVGTARQRVALARLGMQNCRQ
jgi:hypothetical protein